MNSTDLIPHNELAPLGWWLKVPMVTYLLTIHLFGVSSNIVVAIIYGRTSSKSACDWLILTMSITDAFVCFCSPPLYIRSCLRIPLPWKTSILCTLEYWLQLTAMFASCLLLAIIALDRYAKICRPGWLSLTPTMARNLCVITVLICALVSLVPFFGRIMDSHCYISEIRETTVTKIFFTSMFVCFVMSFFIVTFAYSRVCQKIRQKIKVKQKLSENNGLNLSAEQENNQKANKDLPRCISLWSHIFSSLPAKWKIRRRNQIKNENLSQSNSECVYENGNSNGSGENKYNNGKRSDASDSEKTVFLSTHVKINNSEAGIMSCEQTSKLSENNSHRWQTSGAVKTPNQHYKVGPHYSCPDLVSDSDQITRLENEALQVLHNIGEKHGGTFLPAYDVGEVIRTDTAHNNDATSLLPLNIGNDVVDNAHSSLEGTELKDVGDKVVAPTCSRQPVLNTNYRQPVLNTNYRQPVLNTNYADSCGRTVGPKLSSSMPLFAVSKTNLLHAKRKVERNSADEAHRKQKYETMFSYNMNTEDDCVLRQNKGINFKSRGCSSFCLLPRNALLNENTLDKISANNYPNIHVTNCSQRDAGFRSLTSESALSSHIKRNSMVENDLIKVRLPDTFSLPVAPHLNVKQGQVVSRVPCSYTTLCTGCFQNSPEFSINTDACCFCRLATHNNRQRLVKSDPCLSMQARNGHLITCGGNVVIKTEMPGPTSGTQCVFRTNRSPIKESITLQQVPPQSQSSNVVLSDNNKHYPTDFSQKNIPGGKQAALEQFQLGPSTISCIDTPGHTDRIQQERDYSETTIIPSFLLRRSQSAPNPTDEIPQEYDYLDTTDTTSVFLHYPLTQHAVKSTDEMQQEEDHLETTDTTSVFLHHPLTEHAVKSTDEIQQEKDHLKATDTTSVLLQHPLTQHAVRSTDEIQQEYDHLETTDTTRVLFHHPLTHRSLKSIDEIQQEHDHLEATDTTSVLLHHPLTHSSVKSIDEIQQEHDHLETTDTRSALQHRTQSALKPTGSTSSRRSNKSSSFADPVKITLMVDNNDSDDKSEVFSYMSTSPSTSIFRKPRLKGGCRTSGRSRSSVRSSTSSKLRFARERQITYMLLSVTAAFLLSWMPPWVMYISCLYGPMEYFKSSVIQYLATIHLLNYVASPVIYFTFNPTFRSKVSQLFTHSRRCRCCCGKDMSQVESPDLNSSLI